MFDIKQLTLTANGGVHLEIIPSGEPAYDVAYELSAITWKMRGPKVQGSLAVASVLNPTEGPYDLSVGVEGEEGPIFSATVHDVIILDGDTGDLAEILQPGKVYIFGADKVTEGVV